MNEHPVCERLGEVLSPSQVNTYLTCQAKWYFRYLVGLSEPATGALALGKAFHATLAANFRQKMVLGCDMQPAEARDVFAEEWTLASADMELRQHEDVSELAATGEALATTYISEAARSVQPRAVEHAVAGEIDGVKVETGQVIALLDGKLVASASSVEEGCLGLLEKARAEEHELITLFYGQDMTHAEANQLADVIREKYSSQEVEVQEGGQPHYQFIISVE